ncbi:GNAT family N-acetyltransferase [Parabacteroides sp. Marseille-P3160]|uniref:GNAT family N-acetyltransferase n=1 Tax=Parabacteroides sp. Marseille-P3160 TaxID=1917887 RepID=UPI00350F74F6
MHSFYQRNIKCWVYEEDKKVVGLLGFRICENIEENSRFGEISLIVVDPAHLLYN